MSTRPATPPTGAAVPPCDVVAERHCLATAMIGRGPGLSSAPLLADMRRHVKASDFYVPAHAVLWGALCGLADTGKPLEIAAVAAELRRTGRLAAVGRDGTEDGGAVYLGELVDAYGFVPSNAAHYARIVHDLAVLRRAVSAAAVIRERALAPGAEPADVADAMRSALADVTDAGNGGAGPSFVGVGELLRMFPTLRPPVIHGLLRRGEVMNIIAPSKTGKSWLVTDLAIAVATGRSWLGTYATEAGPVLILDNELHGETLANRIPRVAEARGIGVAEFGDRVFVESLRGRMIDLFALPAYFRNVKAGEFRLVILDALYRFWPRDANENDNATVANCFNVLDGIGGELGCSFVLIHHASKGNQSAKAISDVGAGAGAQSRASDTHLILRHHEEEGAVVLDAAVRSWPPIPPMALRWEFPVWNPDPTLDPTALRPDRPARRKRKVETPAEPPAPVWTCERFAAEFLAGEPRPRSVIVANATQAGLGERRATRLLDSAEARGLAFRWRLPREKRAIYANTRQPALVEPE